MLHPLTVLAAALLLAGAAPAAAQVRPASQDACENRPARLAGWYENGVVGPRGATSPIDTWLTADGEGRLQGRYVIHERRGDAPGTLDFQAWTGCRTARFRWHDRYGTGVAEFRFRDGIGPSFEGNYGDEEPVASLIWTGAMRDKPRLPARPKN